VPGVGFEQTTYIPLTFPAGHQHLNL